MSDDDFEDPPGKQRQASKLETRPKKHPKSNTSVTIATTADKGTTEKTTTPPSEAGQGKGKGKYKKENPHCQQVGCLAAKTLSGLMQSSLFIEPLQGEDLEEASQLWDMTRVKEKHSDEKGARFKGLADLLSLLEEKRPAFPFRKLWTQYLHVRINVPLAPECGIHESRQCWNACGTPDIGNGGIRLALPSFFTSFLKSDSKIKKREIPAYWHTLLIFTNAEGSNIKPPKDNEEVSHMCCNGGCCRPSHLMWETHSSNKQRSAEGICMRTCKHCLHVLCECQEAHIPPCIGKSPHSLYTDRGYYVCHENTLLDHVKKINI